ncbi:MAG: apolipoprotein N-acyltransferase [Lewinellaceae bacterium]|nr:apolipoprotein N-acyltransferase [Lewinellaceae bacterium]
MTVSIGILAWIAYAPFLLYLHQTSGWRSRLWFSLAYILAWSVTVFKIVTDPIPFFVIPMYSIPIALFHLPAFLIWARFRGEKFAGLLFPALMIILEWIQYTFTPLGSWGAAAYTQMDHIVLLQSVSLFGLAGLGFLIYWVNTTAAYLIMDARMGLKRVLPPALTLLIVLSFGALRYDLSHSKGRPMIRVAAVGTDSEVGVGPLPSYELRRQNAAILFARTRMAAKEGPELVVWNEAAAAVLPEEEPQWRDSLTALAAECQVPLVAAYVALLSEAPIRYENKYLFIKPDGTIASTYFKHEPVPGEPAVKGTAPFEAHTINHIKMAGAICYDYDFPYIAKAFGKKEVDIVALPASDWRGIDPIHTKMAAFRAVEQGHSILRSTRFGLSAAITPYGELVAQMSSFDENDKIMLAHLPKAASVSLYSLIGDVFVYLCMAFVFWFGIRSTGFQL